MIIIYMNLHQNIDTYNDKLEKIIYHTNSYNFGKITVITEKNQTVIRDILNMYKPYQFITYSLKEFDKFTPTQICELILYMIDKLDITFTTIEDNLYFNKENILTIYPKIFEYYKRKS